MPSKNSLFLTTFLMLVLSGIAHCQTEIYPPHWWSGMKTSSIQLLVRGTDPSLNQSKVSIDYPGVTINKVSTFENGKYLAIDISIAPDAKPGPIAIQFTKGKKSQKASWSLKERNTSVK